MITVAIILGAAFLLFLFLLVGMTLWEADWRDAPRRREPKHRELRPEPIAPSAEEAET